MILAGIGVAVLGVTGVWVRGPGGSPIDRILEAPGGSIVRSHRALMGTLCQVAVWSAPGREPEAAEAARAALEEMAAVEDAVSEWRADSETSAVNRAAGGVAMPVGIHLRALLDRSLHWSRLTDGGFDVSGGPLFDVWEEARTREALPPAEVLAAARARVGWRKIEWNGSEVRLTEPGMKLGFGGIGKGYAADRAADRLRRAGFVDFVVDAGGDLVVGGSRGGSPWEVAIRDPRGPGLLMLVAVRDIAIATSGDAERYFVAGGRRYSHLLDLRTGEPVRGVASATVFAQSGADADALATALCALGAERGLDLVRSLPGVQAMLVLEEKTLRLSPGLSLQGDRLRWSP